jgi:hypothetical protein
MTGKNFLLIIVAIQLIGCVSSRKINYELIQPRKINMITAGKVDTLRKFITAIHPNIYMGIDTLVVDSVADRIVSDNEGKLLSGVDFTLEMRRLTDLFNYVDPHLIYYPSLQVDSAFHGKFKDVKSLPFEIYNINDTLLIKKSYTESLVKGDQLLSVNGYKIDEFKKYIYPTWRSMAGYVMQLQSQLTYSENYQIVVNRKGTVKEFIVGGVSSNHATGERYCTGHIIDEYETGYCKISSFTGNKFIYKELKKQIEKTKAKGYSNFIIDLRGNTGGSGYKLDAMFSLLSDKDSLIYMKSQFIKVSSKTEKDYKFLKGHKKGELVQFPDKLTFRKAPLEKDLYQGEMNYYLMIDKSTASIAASFANIFQYNNVGRLVGESLDHNSLNFGDVVSIKAYANLIISTVQYNENTKCLDGILVPDIEIPYVAKEYMAQEDPILNKLLDKLE